MLKFFDVLAKFLLIKVIRNFINLWTEFKREDPIELVIFAISEILTISVRDN